MAVGVVAFDAVAEPQDLVHSERSAQHGFDLGSAQVGVAIRVQQTLLGREHHAGAVHVDRAAFENHRRGKPRDAERFGHLPAHDPIEIVRRVFPAPGVVLEVEGKAWLRALPRHENRAVVARPRIVGREAVERDALGRRNGCELAAHVALMLGIEHVDVHRLARGERAHELDHRRLDLLVHTRPAVAIVRPRQPGRLVRRPFGRHPVAALAWPSSGIGAQITVPRTGRRANYTAPRRMGRESYLLLRRLRHVSWRNRYDAHE